MTDPLRVVMCTDGRPGHEKQTRAVLAAMAAMTPLSVETCALAPTSGWRRLAQGFRAWVAPDGSGAGLGLRAVDLIIGAGSTAHLPMIALKRRSRARLVVCMSPDPLLRRWFDLCLVPRHDCPPVRKNIFPTFGPPCIKISGGRHDTLQGLILAGGIDPKSHRWDTSAFMAQVRQLRDRMPEVRWTISSSPRTPADTVEMLQRLAENHRNVAFFRAEETPSGWIESAYQAHGLVWVTADSVSMVYEALTAGCRVGILPVAWNHPHNKFQKGIDDLTKHDLVLDYQRWQAGASWPETPEPLNEAERCASEILRRWWPTRLA
jgi:mitochondrial fission protein ELM1